ncbi:MAG TPA: 6-carboxytetrahydropterin synthase [Anaerolineae bacterium]|nr:6-carboxytetrahydropterin synthase [Anaerolineae bacterium]
MSIYYNVVVAKHRVEVKVTSSAKLTNQATRNTLFNMKKYSIHVEKDYLKFSAAHFLVFGEKCERLHGHNYAVSVDLEGELDDIGYIFDFIMLKEFAENHCNELDHKTIIPSKNKHLQVTESNGNVEVSFRDKKFIFPESDVVILPIKNCTAELLAYYLSKKIRGDLKDMGADNISLIKVGVEESPGQIAYYVEKMD